MSMPLELTLAGTLTPAQTMTYIYLPFEVPRGIGQIDVRYSYDAAISSDPTLTGGNTIDIGIFDTRGIEFLNAGYRGWTGSARSEFTISTTEATPGYMPGPIQPGTWNICLGAYKVAPDGCHYQVDIRLYPSSSPAQVTFPRRLPLDDHKAARISADGWYSGEIHCHTINSDGDSTTSEVVDLAESLDLDFLAIMDHNNLTHQVDLANIDTSLVLIPGYEVTTYYGHWNIWGDGPWVDFRVQRAEDMQQAIAFAREHGYLTSCNHPRPFGPDWAFPEVENYDCIEVWNGPWELFNSACVDFWETRLKRGQKRPAVGGSDFHFSHKPHIAQLARPMNVVYVPPDRMPTARAILDAIRAGHCFVTDSPVGPHLTIQSGAAMMGDTITRPANGQLALAVDVKRGFASEMQLVSAQGVLYSIGVDAEDVRFELDGPIGDSPYVRAQLVDALSGNVRAVTNPIYIAPAE